MEYTELEKKIITKGKRDFRRELELASKPMLEVLNKYGIRNGNPLLKEITLTYPYEKGYSEHAVRVPDDKGLACLESFLLDMFIKEIKMIQDKLDDFNI